MSTATLFIKEELSSFTAAVFVIDFAQSLEIKSPANIFTCKIINETCAECSATERVLAGAPTWQLKTREQPTPRLAETHLLVQLTASH